jgi:hypothetical protein
VLERPRYSPGLILQDSDLTAAVDYTSSLNRLLFRSLFGCGVVCGLNVEVSEVCGLNVTVRPGLALDARGNPIELTNPETITIRKAHEKLTEGPSDYWVLLHSRERSCEPRPLVCDGDEEGVTIQPTRIKSCAEISIVTCLPKCMCEHIKWSDKALPPDLDAKANALIKLDKKDLELSLGAECGSGCGCGGDCGCGDPVLLAWVHRFEPNKKWGPIHRGVRRFIRPTLLADPIEDKVP